MRKIANLTKKQQAKIWEEVWKGDAGQMVIEKITTIKNQYIEMAMRQYVTAPGGEIHPVGRDDQLSAICRAQGVQEVLDCIKAGIDLANEKEEEKTE